MKNDLYLGNFNVSKIKGAVVRRKNGKIFIDVTNCNLYEGKNDALYADVAVYINPEPDQYGNSASIKQNTGDKEDKIYLANLKKYVKDGESQSSNTSSKQPKEDPDDDLPF